MFLWGTCSTASHSHPFNLLHPSRTSTANPLPSQVSHTLSHGENQKPSHAASSTSHHQTQLTPSILTFSFLSKIFKSPSLPTTELSISPPFSPNAQSISICCLLSLASFSPLNPLQIHLLSPTNVPSGVSLCTSQWTSFSSHLA